MNQAGLNTSASGLPTTVTQWRKNGVLHGEWLSHSAWPWQGMVDKETATYESLLYSCDNNIMSFVVKFTFFMSLNVRDTNEQTMKLNSTSGIYTSRISSECPILH